MKCTEYFENLKEAENFVNSLNYENANPEIVNCYDEETNEEVYIVYYNPPKYKK